jgi:hypothetical protein
MGINPNTYETLPLPNNHQLDLDRGGFVTAGGSGMVPCPSISEEQLTMAHHHQNQQPRVISYQSSNFQEDKAGYAPLKKKKTCPTTMLPGQMAQLMTTC